MKFPHEVVGFSVQERFSQSGQACGRVTEVPLTAMGCNLSSHFVHLLCVYRVSLDVGDQRDPLSCIIHCQGFVAVLALVRIWRLGKGHEVRPFPRSRLVVAGLLLGYRRGVSTCRKPFL